MSHSLSDLYDLLSVTAFGCNAEVDKILADFHEAKGLGKPYFFAEYICSQPLFRGIEAKMSAIKGVKVQDWSTDIYVMAPFASRMIRDSLRIPKSSAKIAKQKKVSKKIPFTLNTEEELYKLKIILPYEQSSFFHPFFEIIWSKINAQLSEGKIEAIRKTVNKRMKRQLSMGAANLCTFRGFSTEIEENYRHLPILELKDFGDKVLTTYRHNVILNDKFVAVNKLLHYEILKLRWGSGENQGRDCYSAIIPIASPLFLYGFLWIWLPVFKKKDHKSERENLYLKIASYIKDVYAPTLAIVFESFSEKLAENNVYYDATKKRAAAIPLTFNKLYPKKTNLNWYIPFLLFADGTAIKKKNTIDDCFIDLWNARILNPDYAREESGWPFKNYVVASKQMIQKMNDTIVSANSFTQSGSSLPSALVIGSPGSGKDSMPDILRAFSKRYREGPLYKLNIAAIKPNFLIAPVFTGVEIRYGDNKNLGSKEEKYLDGILGRIRENTFFRFKTFTQELSNKYKKTKCKINVDTIDEALKLIKAIHNEECFNKKYIKKNDALKKELDKFAFPTLVLDELNSLDIDSQGILLRYLENSEIVPTGGITDRWLKDSSPIKADDLKDAVKWLTNCLIIGVMNEDPDEITREKSIDFLRNESYLGGFLSDVLYEHMLRIRRLRPDVKYRMVRNGKIIIPSLKERYSDIPVLFYFYSKKEVESLSKQQGNKPNPATYVTFHAFDRLMSPELKWHGNIRELQALAKKAAYLAWADPKNNDAEVLVRKTHIQVALKQLED